MRQSSAPRPRRVPGRVPSGRPWPSLTPRRIRDGSARSSSPPSPRPPPPSWNGSPNRSGASFRANGRGSWPRPTGNRASAS